jgi:hypothetical protein
MRTFTHVSPAVLAWTHVGGGRARLLVAVCVLAILLEVAALAVSIEAARSGASPSWMARAELVSSASLAFFFLLSGGLWLKCQHDIADAVQTFQSQLILFHLTFFMETTSLLVPGVMAMIAFIVYSGRALHSGMLIRANRGA